MSDHVEPIMMTCIVCPKGCQLSIDFKNKGEITVTGNDCIRGLRYAEQEMTDPRRNIASTVRVLGGNHPVCPVKTKVEIPKGKIQEVMAAINQVTVQAPIQTGDIIIANVCGTGVDIVATRRIKKG